MNSACCRVDPSGEAATSWSIALCSGAHLPKLPRLTTSLQIVRPRKCSCRNFCRFSLPSLGFSCWCESLFAGPCSHCRLGLDARAIQAKLPTSFPIMSLAANDLRGLHVCLYQREGVTSQRLPGNFVSAHFSTWRHLLFSIIAAFDVGNQVNRLRRQSPSLLSRRQSWEACRPRLPRTSMMHHTRN